MTLLSSLRRLGTFQVHVSRLQLLSQRCATKILPVQVIPGMNIQGTKRTLCLSPKWMTSGTSSAISTAGVLKSPYPEVHPPLLPVTEFVFQNSQLYPDRAAVIDGETGEILTYAALKEAVSRVASGLSRYGFREGDVMMMYMSNRPEYVIMFHAVLSLRGSISMANPQYRVEELKTVLSLSGAKFIFAEKDTMHNAMAGSMMCPNQVQEIFVLGEDSHLVPFRVLLEDDGSAFPQHVTFDPLSDVALIPFTSGTTGLPKAICLSHYGLVANVYQLDHPDFFAERDGLVQLGILPFYHMFAGFINMVLALAWGHTTVTVKRFQADQFLRILQDFKVNLLFAVPPMLVMMAKHPQLDDFDLSHLRRVCVGAAPIPGEITTALEKKLPNCNVGQVYGMSETSIILTASPLKDLSPGSVGVLVPSTEVKFVMDGRVCAVEEKGELWARGPQIMLGYLNNPEADKECLVGNGWLRTGDIGYFDDKRYIYIVDRLKEFIKYKGFQVAPAELEHLLVSHPGVLDAGVTAVEDELAGQLPKAYVVLNKEFPVTIEELKEYVTHHVAPYKKLRGGIETIDAIPKTPSGKILRRVLKELANKK